jgi:DNA repair exonuclease SbcCD ATPase subunit
MADNSLLERQLTDIQSELASAKEENKSLRAQIEEFASKEQGEFVSKLEASVSEKEEAIKALEVTLAEKETQITELQETVAKSEEEMKEKTEELNKMKKEQKMQARKAALVNLGFNEEEAEESLASYEDLNDETFDILVAGFNKMKSKKDTEEKEEEKPTASEEVVAEEVSAEEAVAEEAAKEALEDVETSEATLVDATDEQDELLATRANVAEWLETNVLRK